MKTSFLVGRVGVAVAAALTLAAGPAALGQELYLLNAIHSQLTRVDGPTGDTLEELPILGATRLRRGLAARWDGLLYTYDDQFVLDRLLRIDPHTGQGEAMGGELPSVMWTIAADPGTGVLYGTHQGDDLYRIDHETGEGTLIGKVTNPQLFAPAMAMAIGRDGFGYVTDRQNYLFRVDLETVETSFVCVLGSMNWYEDFDFDDDGVLWGAWKFDAEVRRIDIAECAVEHLHKWLHINGLEVVPGGPACYPDCDGDGALNLFDFLCFINGFNAADERADCNGDEKFDLFDFLCFTNSFNAGC